MLTMHPDARRNGVLLLGEIDSTESSSYLHDQSFGIVAFRSGLLLDAFFASPSPHVIDGERVQDPWTHVTPEPQTCLWIMTDPDEPRESQLVHGAHDASHGPVADPLAVAGPGLHSVAEMETHVDPG